MLKNLKRKFILINMLLVTAVLAIAAAANLVSTYRAEKAQLDRSLDRVLEARQVDAPPEREFEKDRPQIGKDNLPEVYAFLAETDRNGEIVRTYALNADMDEDTLKAAANAALEGGETGRIAGEELVYKKRGTAQGGALIAFASSASMSRRISQTALLSAVVFAASFVLLLGVCIFLSNLAVKPAEKAWEQQKQFVADASHDLKTPLTVILANNNILRAHADQTVASQQKWLDSTEEETGRMRALTNKLLELARSENLKSVLKPEEADIAALCEQIVLQFDPVAFEAGVTLESVISQNTVIKTDADSFSRLAYILVDNAIKYSKKGGTVTVLLKKEKKKAVLKVRNFGTPIPQEDLPRLFERFYRADKARGEGGYGLGLAIAKNITEALGGEIAVKSDEKDGTVFTVTL